MTAPYQLELSALDGANPLAFLAALGVIATLDPNSDAGSLLAWRRTARFTPVLQTPAPITVEGICSQLAAALTGRPISEDAALACERANNEWSNRKSLLRKADKGLKARGIRSAERSESLRPLVAKADDARQAFLARLRDAAPRPEMILGNRLDCTPEEFRACVASLTSPADRGAIDMLTALGSDACPTDGKLSPTHFCFISGSGHQFFLETALALTELASPEKVAEALFESWSNSDSKYSMRWDPGEDRRYAYLGGDPSKKKHKLGTVWMANLLAYRALALYPCYPSNRQTTTAGWRQRDGELQFTWPIWQNPLSLDAIRSLLHSVDLQADTTNHELHMRGVVCAFRSRRLRAGSGINFKLNFSPPMAVL